MSIKRFSFLAVNKTLPLLPRPLRRFALNGIANLPFERRPPSFIAIEPTNGCNLKCPLCPVGAGTMKRKIGFMDLEKYQGLIEEISPHTSRVLMNFAGEPLLHPHIGEMVCFAQDRGIEITLGTHGNIDKMEEIVDAGVSEVLFALDGSSPETYGQYRIGGSLDQALSNLEKLVTARNKSKTGSTRIILQFVVMRHNCHEIDEIKKIGREFGVDEISLQPVCVNDFFPGDHADLVAQWVPDDSPFQLHPGEQIEENRRRPPICVWAIQSVVLHNGDVTVCCFDPDGSTVVGNAFDKGGFRAVWVSQRYRQARRQVVLQDLDICRKCDISLSKATRVLP